MSEINPILKKIIEVMPIFQSIFPFDSMPAVSDIEKIIAYFPGKTIDSHAKIGEPLTKGSGLFEAIHDKKMMSSVVPKEIFGFTFRAISMPIFDENNNDEIVGAIGFAYSIETQFALQEMAQSIATSSEELNAVSEEFSATASGLASRMNDLSKSSNSMFQYLEKTDDILEFIENIADKTKMLGLNALIEAARAGEHGKSFTVVAHEIQKMSEHSVKSLDTIKTLLRNIQTEVKTVNNLINETRELSSQQSIASLEIFKSIESLSRITESLSEISLKL